MEAVTVSNGTQAGFFQRMGPALVPVLLIAVGYVDPGKWVATVEGGARFGFDLVAIMLIFNLAAVLCQYVAARISVASDRNLAQICNDEYDKWTCMFLGVQAEFSAILLDLTMVTGVAHALNLLFGVDLATGVFLAAIDAFLFPIFASILDNRVANTVSICSAGLVLFFYVSGVLSSQPEMPFSMNGMLMRLNGESAFALMSLLGANIMPHNFYLHSYLALESKSPPDVSKSSLCQDHFFAIVCVFSGLSLVNHMLMNAAANVFNSTGLVLLTFQDAISLMEQVFRCPLVPLAFLVLLFFSNQLTALAWTFGGEVVLHDFLNIEIPYWLHRATIRILTVAPALYCVWTSGAEGMYQLLIFTQVLVAMMLPSSVIPLFRVASSRQIMGVHKISQIVEFLALATFMGMLGLNIIFVVEMLFGNSDWAGSLRWNSVIGTSVPYITLLVFACASLCLMLWLAATPLRSASNQIEAQVWDLDIQNKLSYSVQEEETERSEASRCEEEALTLLGNSAKGLPDTSTASSCYDLPETILMSEQEFRSSSLVENESNFKFSAPQARPTEEPDVKEQPVSPSPVVSEVIGDDLAVETNSLKIELTSPVEKTVNVENNRGIEKDFDEGDTLEPVETPKSVGNLSVLSDGPPSFRSLSGKSDEGGSGTGSLSRLAGLGRAARKHLSVILDEFWGQLYDFHGQLVAEAKAKKLDQLLGVDQKAVSSAKTDSFRKDISGYYVSPSERGLDSPMNSGSYDALLKQQRVPGSIDSLYGLQRGSSPLANRVQLLDAYGNTNRNSGDSGERRYYSLRVPGSSEGWDYQPATVHSHQITSYLNRLAKERSLQLLHSQVEIPTSRSPSLGAMSYTEQLALVLRQKSQNGINHPGPAPGFQNLAASRNIIQSERSYLDIPASGSADNIAMAVNEKKYGSMPDISRIAIANRGLHLSNKTGYWDGPTGGGYGTPFGRTSIEPSLYSNSGSRVSGTPLVFDELSPSRGYRGAFAMPQHSRVDNTTGSLWSRQPFEQFGVAEKNSGGGGDEQPKNGSNAMYIDATSTVDSEAKLLQSFRHCILKLLKMEGSDWLFRQGNGVDEELIDQVAAREKFIYEAETREINQVGHAGAEPLVSSVPNCGDGCIWRVDLIVSFGVWCIHRVLNLSFMESRPELWGKYTYVLNRLQGVIDLAFSKPRTPMLPCFCLQIPASHQQQRASPPAVSNGMLPPMAKPARGKLTTATMLLDLIREVETAISCRKGRSGTAAGDVAFPKGKENLASVLKRYKRRLSNKPVIMSQDGPGSRKNLTAAVYGS